MRAKKSSASVRLKKHSAPAATADQIRKAAGISDEKMLEIRKRLKVHGLIGTAKTAPQKSSTSRKPVDSLPR